MGETRATDGHDRQEPGAQDEPELRKLWRDVLLRLSFLYFIPIVLLAVFFHIELGTVVAENERIHLTAMAEQRAGTLDLFMSERLIDLADVAHELTAGEEIDRAAIDGALASLRHASGAFVELGVLDGDGRVLAYSGPHPDLQTRSYSEERWFVRLRDGNESSLITDSYRGFRDEPHFTIAVRRSEDGRYRALRAVLSPAEVCVEVNSGRRDRRLWSAVVNVDGIFQAVCPNEAALLTASPFRPPPDQSSGTSTARLDGAEGVYGYAWLRTTPWALVVHGPSTGWAGEQLRRFYRNVALLTGLFFLLGGILIYISARATVRRLWRARTKQRELSGQLVQAAKLASVGELAAGIAHEINNPLAVVVEEAGLLKDLMDPELGEGLEEHEIKEHLETIEAAAFRGRDITRKLLGFVRRTEVTLTEVDMHEVLDGVADGLLGHELELAKVQIDKRYGDGTIRTVTDRNQLEQVLLNLMKNAVDAMEGAGTLTLRTVAGDELLKIYVQDTGCGMTQDQLERIFNPFFTTKEPGKGTGLGLSVSHGIVQSLGGELYVESTPGEGSTFIVQLPIEIDPEQGETP